ncbi:hypothetical protein B591_31058 (plasmid) [Streptomyces sp. GBA 94-10 4N24]|uniref:hypothetical protein n=1 Tax=Streptomyces sp. GBA 94-10 4N24 TaxID=1218177 RepID=UPI0003C30C08|nr:hypothetical protein [Streptomyces sp. GBA 94-10 4N24]ESP95731.1 hypothetical protein B591_31058 [Streptomyces sp. GBA 94-10 4N24]UZN63191.1 hypothetical protein B591N_31058 [Streptomyces sp. GBA 94-10 4N24]
MRHRPATFAALLGLTRAASAIGDFWVQDDFCAQVKGASDDHPVTYIDPTTEQKTTHGTADGRKACLKHVLSLRLEVEWARRAPRFPSSVA